MRKFCPLQPEGFHWHGPACDSWVAPEHWPISRAAEAAFEEMSDIEVMENNLPIACEEGICHPEVSTILDTRSFADAI